VVLNTINGDTNVAFFRELRDKGVTAQRTPVISSSLDAAMLRNLNPRHVAGHYAAWSYFQAVPGPVNEEFVRRFREAYGEHRVVTDPMEAAWLGVQFWAKAVEESGGCEVKGIRRAIRGQRLDAPEGPGVKVDEETQHTWKYFRLGRVTEDARFEVVSAFDAPDCPEPFPPPRPRKYWEDYLAALYKGWGNRWSNPGD
jgi:urea transport system substrate-binding protein